VDGTTDRAFLETTLRRASANVTAESPNWRAAGATAHLFAVRQESGLEIGPLFQALNSGIELSTPVGSSARQ
jgi:hypothetical protein